MILYPVSVDQASRPLDRRYPADFGEPLRLTTVAQDIIETELRRMLTPEGLRRIGLGADGGAI